MTLALGLGVMGYSMAVNLRSKMDSSATLLICDINEAALEKFQKQMAGKGPIEVVKTGKEAASRAVCLISFHQAPTKQPRYMWTCMYITPS